jgi:hypothetical protein
LHTQRGDALASSTAKLEEYLESLGLKVGDLSSEVDRFLEGHPKASVVSAFLLGIAIGRASKG